MILKTVGLEALQILYMYSFLEDIFYIPPPVEKKSDK
jgi:hypothetical protein